MRRRKIVEAAAAAITLATVGQAGAQRARVRLALVAAGKAFPFRYFIGAMGTLGWTEGGTFDVTTYILGNDPRQRDRIAAEVLEARPDLVIAAGVSDALAVHRVNDSIPIVVVTGTDLEHSGLVQSLRHPGGAVTGISTIGMDLSGKHLELLRELLPGIKRVGVLGNPTYPNDRARFDDAMAHASRLSITVHRRSARTPDELDAVFAAAEQDGDQAILVPYNALTFENMPRLLALADKHRLPGVFEVRDYVEAGGLVSFGPVYRQYFTEAARLADKILKGARPGDIPIEQPIQFELVLNLKTARKIGLAPAPALLARADEVIE